MIIVTAVDGAGIERVFATHDDAQQAEILRLPDYAGRNVYSVEGHIVPGAVVPEGAIRLNPPLDLHDYAAARRKAILETHRLAIGPFTVPTDETTRNVLTAGYVKASANPSYSIADWKVGPAQYIVLDAPTIMAIADAVEGFVQIMFGRNRTADEAIEGGTATTTEQVDAILEA